MAETRGTFDGPIFQAYFNEPRILWSSVDVGFPENSINIRVPWINNMQSTQNVLRPDRIDERQAQKGHIPFQYNLPQAFPCWPSNFSFVLVTNQYEFAMPFCPHRVCDTVIPTPSCGYLLSTW
jgi:hypothetical protein